MRYNQITAIGAFTSLNAATGDTLQLDPARCSGRGGADLRTTVEDAPGADGILWFPARDGQQVITLGGIYVIRSAVATDAAYVSAQDTMESALLAALATLKSTAGTLTHSGGSLTVAYHNKYEPDWNNGQLGCTFGLIVT